MSEIIAGTIDKQNRDFAGKKGIKAGKCDFPFLYKGDMVNECVDHPSKGLWCATEVDPTTRKVVKMGFCPSEKTKTKQTKKKSPLKSKVSKKITAGLIDKRKKNFEGVKGYSSGECQFPFLYKGEMKENCQDHPEKGLWCATKVDPKSRSVKSIGFCPNEEEKSKVKTVKKGKLTIVPKKKSKIDVAKYTSPPKDLLIPKEWELPNRKQFSNWVDSSYNKYRISKQPKKLECAEVTECQKMELFSHQKLVRDFLQINSPYRGLLLYHGLGVGKTCASISIAEGFKQDKFRKIYILLNKSLKQNFKLELMKCGDDYYRLNNHWVFIEATKSSPEYYDLVKFGIPNKLIVKNNGGWLIDFSKKPNYESLSSRQAEQLKEQIEAMIDSRYEFIHMNGLNAAKLKKMREDKILDNSLLIIDEVHNLTNGMAKDGPGVRAKYLEKIIMEANNLKLVFLSGTPMINNLFEAGKLFNLLRGYIITFNIIIKKTSRRNVNWTKLEKLADHPLVDQIFFKRNDYIIQVTKNPSGFINKNRNSKLIKEGPEITDEQFIEILKQDLKKNHNLEFDYTINKNTALPNDQDTFVRKFFDPIDNKLININLFKSRILGLVSHYRTFKKDLMPDIKVEEVTEVPMSEYQFLNYSKVRKDEIEQDRNKKKTGKTAKPQSQSGTPSPGKKVENIFEAKSSYRAYSRMHCSFVFPESIDRPTPSGVSLGSKKSIAAIEKEQQDDIDDVVYGVDDESKEEIPDYEKAKNECLKQLDLEKYEHLIQDDPERLNKYSPKYNIIMQRVKSCNGPSFIYTEYRTLEGIAVFSIVLKANGFSEFRLIKNELDEWHIAEELPEDVGKPKFAFWSGDEESGLMLKIFNNDLESLPQTLREDVLKLGKDNVRGDIIKCILTTKKGAEGISIMNIRQVHIIEPYWNPVRLEQVKGRAIRVGSHLKLPKEDRNVELYLYLAVMTPEQLKSDRTINDDSDGKSSDQVLFDISQKKLQIMQELLTAIKEVSIDCTLNARETQDPEDRSTLFKCVNYSSKSRNDYNYIPDILAEREDREQKKAQKLVRWDGVKKDIPKLGPVIIRKDLVDGKKLVYDYEKVMIGRPGDPIGEVIGSKLTLY